MNKDEVVDHLETYAELLRLDGTQSRAIARERAARSIRMSHSIPPDPSRLSNVGSSIRDDVVELQRGSYPKEYEHLREEYDWYLTLGELNGIGPERAKTLHDTFNAESLDDILLIGSDLTIVDGIGEATVEKILDSAESLSEQD